MGRIQNEKSTQLQTRITFHEKIKRNQKAEPKAQRGIEIIFRLCNLIKDLPTFAWLDSGIAADPSTPLLNRADCSGYPMSVPRHILHARGQAICLFIHRSSHLENFIGGYLRIFPRSLMHTKS